MLQLLCRCIVVETSTRAHELLRAPFRFCHTAIAVGEIVSDTLRADFLSGNRRGRGGREHCGVCVVFGHKPPAVICFHSTLELFY